MKIFEDLNSSVDEEYNAKWFLNAMYEQGYFIACIDSILNRENVVVQYDCCFFPDWENNESSEHFTGVKFVLFKDVLVISEAACSAIVDLACTRYVQLHPEDSAKLTKIIQARLF